MRFQRFFILSHPLLLYLLYFLSSYESYSLDDESDDDGSDSGSSGECAFNFRFDDSVGRFSGVGSVFFGPIGVDSNCEVATFVVFVPLGVESKNGQLIEMFWH